MASGGGKFLHFGDLVAFQSDNLPGHEGDTGFLYSGGFIDDRVFFSLLESGTQIPPNLRDCRFTLVSKYQYAKTKDLSRYLSEIGKDKSYLDDEEAEKDSKLQRLIAATKEEREINEVENGRIIGKPISYGTVVQLLHVASGKFVTIEKTVAEFNRKALKIQLTNGGNEGCWFTINPGYKTLAHGSPVRLGDIVVFASEKYAGQSITVTDIDWERSETLTRPRDKKIVDVKEVVAASSNVLMKVVPQAPNPKAIDYDFSEVLNGGDVVSFMHKDTDSFLTYEKGHVWYRVPRKISHNALKSSNVSWKVEGTRLEWAGETVHFNATPIRIKHFASNLYLAAGRKKKSKKEDEDALDLDVQPTGAKVGGEDSDVKACSLYVTDDYSSTDTLWYLVPFDSDSSHVEFNQLAYIRHYNRGWLHELGFVYNDQIELAKKRKMRRAGMSESFKERDVILISRIPADSTAMTLACVRLLDNIDNFVDSMNAKIPNATEGNVATSSLLLVEYERSAKFLMSLMSRIIMSLSDSSDRNPFTREGLPKRPWQKAMREQRADETIINLLTLPFKKGLKVRGSKFPSIESPEALNILKINQLAYRALKLFCKGYRKNKMVLSQYLPVMLGHLGGSMKPALAMMEMFTSCLDLVSTEIKPWTVKSFVERIVQDKTPRFVLFLQAIITVDGLPMPMNQEMVVRYFFGEGTKQEPLKHGSLLLPARRDPSTGELQMGDDNGGWANFSSFKAEENEIFKQDIDNVTPIQKKFRYFVRCVDLLRDLLLGRNRVSFEVIITRNDLCLRYEELLETIFDSKLPAMVRNSYCQLLLRLYVDRDPYSQVNHVRGNRASDDILGQDKLKRGFSTDLFHHLNPFSSSKYEDFKPTPGFVDLKDMCVTYLAGLHGLDASKRSENMLTLSIMNTLVFLYDHGFYTGVPGMGKLDMSEIRKLFEPLISLIEDTHDKPGGSLRYKWDEDSQLVMDIKVKALYLIEGIMELTVNLRANACFEMFDSGFKKSKKTSDLTELKKNPMGSSQSLQLPKQKRMASVQSVIDDLSEKYPGIQDRVNDSLDHHRAKRLGHRARRGSSSALNMWGNISTNFGGDGSVVDAFTDGEFDELVDRLFNKPQVNSILAASSNGLHLKSRLIEALFELTNYSYPLLVESALRVLSIHMQQRVFFIHKLRSLTVFRTNSDLDIYNSCLFNVFELRRLRKWLPPEAMVVFQQRERANPYDLCIDSISKLMAFLDPETNSPESVRQAQNIMRNSSVHVAMNEILSLPLTLNANKEPLIPIRRDLFQKCYTFLAMFAAKNQLNQKVLFPFVETYSGHMGTKDLNVVNTLQKIAEDNLEIIRDWPDRVSRKVVSLILDIARNPRWLNYFRTFIIVNKKPVKRMQTQTIKTLLDNDLLELGGDKHEGRKKLLTRRDSVKVTPRVDLMQAEDHKKPFGSFLKYHCLSIEMLAMCARGKAKSNEVKCRAILNFEDVMDNLVNQLNAKDSRNKKVSADTLRYVKTSYMIYLNDVFVDTNHPAAVQDVRNIRNNYWFVVPMTSVTKKKKEATPLFLHIDEELRLMVERLDKGKDSLNDNQRADFDIAVRYVFDSIVPFLHTYYLKHYSPADAPRDIAEVMAEMTVSIEDSLVKLVAHPLIEDVTGMDQYDKADNCLQAIKACREDRVDEFVAEQNLIALQMNEIQTIHEWHPDRLFQEEWDLFVVRLGGKLGIRDWSRMIGVGLRNLALVMSDPKRDWVVGNISRFLANEPKTSPDVSSTYLRVIRAAMYFDPNMKKDKYKKKMETQWNAFIASHKIQNLPIQYIRESQIRYNTQRVAEMTTAVVQSTNPAVELAALRLLIVMLQDGNLIVQNSLADYFSSEEGRLTGFFKAIYTEFRESIVALHVREKLVKQIAKGLASVEERDAVGVGNIAEILAVIELLCAGGNKFHQDMIRGQPLNFESYDILGEIVSYAMVLQGDLTQALQEDDRQILKIVEQIFRTLTAVCSGPNQANQEWIMRGKFVELVNRVLDVMGLAVDDQYITISKMWTKIKHGVLRFLMAMLEGVMPEMTSFLVETLDFDRYFGVRDKVVEQYKNGLGKKDREWRNLQLEEINYFEFIVKIIGETERGKSTVNSRCRYFISEGCTRMCRMKDTNLCIVHRSCQNTDSSDLVDANSCSVEIMRNRIPETVYFHTFYEKAAMNSSKNSRIAMLSSIFDEYTDDNTVRVETFMHIAYNTLFDMYHQYRLKKNWATWWIPRVSNVVREAPYYVAILINLLLILFLNTAGWIDSDFGENIFISKAQTQVYYVARGLMGLHLLLSVCMAAVFLLERGPPIIFQRMNASGKFDAGYSSNEKVKVDATDFRNSFTSAHLVKTSSRPLAPIYLLPFPNPLNGENWSGWLYFVILYPLFSVLGNAVSPLFFIYHLFDIMRDKVVGLVIQSVTKNSKKIWKTGLLGFIFVYLFAAITFVTKPNKFPQCSSLYSCILAFLHRGTVGDNLAGLDSYSFPSNVFESESGLEEIYDALVQISFAIVFIIIVIAVVSGIIIDSFGELRDEVQRTTDELKNGCYICGLSKSDLDQTGSGYGVHVREEHNWWHYLYLVAYIENRDATLLSGQEHYLKKMLSEEDYRFFPVGISSVVEANKRIHEEVEEDASEQLNALVESLNEFKSSVAEKLSSIEASQASLQLQVSSKGKNKQSDDPTVDEL